MTEIDAVDRKAYEALGAWSEMATVDRNVLRESGGRVSGLSRDAARGSVINEALEIARKFSSPESVQFINGVLDSGWEKSRAVGSPFSFQSKKIPWVLSLVASISWRATQTNLLTEFRKTKSFATRSLLEDHCGPDGHQVSAGRARNSCPVHCTCCRVFWSLMLKVGHLLNVAIRQVELIGCA